MKPSPKKIEILDYAQELIQTRGYNGFSFADIAAKVGIRKASIHHYFPSKDALGVAVIRRYKETFQEALENINQTEKTWLDKIKAYSKLYENVLNENRLCLCGMLAADIETLPRVLKKEVKAFFADNVAWLSSQLGSRYKTLATKRLDEIAWQIISSLQGAVTLARMTEQTDIFFSTSNELYVQLGKIK